MVAVVRFLPFLLLAAFVSLTLPMPLASAANLSDPNPANDKWIEGTIIIHEPNVTTMELSGTLTIRKYVVKDTDIRTADDLGNAYQQLLQADEYAQKNGQASHRSVDFVNSLSDNISSSLETSLKSAFPTASVTVDPAGVMTSTLASPSGDPYAPGVQALISARIVRSASDLGLPSDLKEDAVTAAFQVGAVITSSLKLTANPGEDITYVITPFAEPAGLAFSDPTGEGATVQDGNLAIHLNQAAATTAKTSDVSFKISLPGAPSYDAQKADLAVTVDLKDLDITFSKAIGGDLGNLVGEVTVVGKLNVIEIPASTKQSLGDKVSLSYLSSDGIRLLKQKGVLDDAKLQALQDELKKQLKEKLDGALGTSVTVDASLDAASLALPISAPLSADKPIVFNAHASFTKPLSGGSSGGQGAAIALYKQTQSFDLPKVQNLDTAYTVILPKGLAVTNLDVSGGQSTTGTAPDGRDQFTVTPQKDSAHATVTMAVTPTFVFAKFLGIVLLALLLLVLIIASPIAIVVLRRRKKKQG